MHSAQQLCLYILSATAIVNVGAAKLPLTFIVATRFHNARGSLATS